MPGRQNQDSVSIAEIPNPTQEALKAIGIFQSIERPTATLETVRRSEERKIAVRSRSQDSKWDGDIGEGVALRFVSSKLDLTPDPRFDQSWQGLDGVCIDRNGDLVLIEAKLDKRGLKALRGDQMQPEWVERNARLMQNRRSKKYTPGNSEIASEILQQGADKVRRLVVTIDPSTLALRCYEGRPDRSWHEILADSAFGFSQPYL